MRRDSTADTIVRFCAVLLPGFLVVFFVPVASVTVAQAKTILLAVIILVAVIAWGVGRYRDRTVRLPSGLIPLAALLLPVTYVLSALIHGASATSLAGGMGEQDTVAAMSLLFGCLLLCAVAFEDSADATVAYTRSFALGGLALMVVQLFHILVPGVTLGVLTSSATSIFGSWHELGIISGLLLFVSCALWGTPATEGRWKWIFVALGISSGLMLFVVNVSDVWYALGALIILFGLYQWRTSVSEFVSRRGDNTAASRVIAMLIIGIVALVCGYGGSFIYSHLPAPMRMLNTEVRPSWNATFAVGKGVFTGVVPVLFGSGPNTFTREWSLYKPAGVNNTDFWNVDFNAGVGFIPTAFVTVGILGVGAWLLLLLALFAAAFDFMRERARAPARTVTAAIFASVLYLVLFHILYVPGAGLSALTFALLGALAVGGVHDGRWNIPLRSHNRSGVARTVAVLFIPVALVFSSVFTLRAVLSDVLVSASAVAYTKTNDIQHALALVGSALTVNSHNARAQRAAVEIGLLELSQISSQGATPAAAGLQKLLQATIEHGLAAVSIDSGGYRNWLAIANLYQSLAGVGVQGAYENAKMAYERARTDNPGSPLPLISLAQLNIAEKKYSDALELLNQAIALKGDLPAAYTLRAQVHVALSNIPAAIADATTVTRATPDDPQSWYNLGIVLYSAGSYADAANALQKAVALQQDYADALFVLGLSYDNLGRTDDALNVLMHVQRLNPTDATLPKMIQNIQAGKPALSSATGTPTSAKKKSL
ncbi:MAG: tetratricopeptide repeat protein [Patescibacteria group bacterium]